MSLPHHIVKGTIYHHRLTPADHAFEYPVYYLALELGALSQYSLPPFFTYNRPGLVSLHDGDFLDASPAPLQEKCRRFMGTTGELERIILVTCPRILGYAFNPVSFYIGLVNNRPARMLAEVNNTFGERHVYQLTKPSGQSDGYTHFTAAKDFHVSPFNDRQGDYLFRVRWGESQLEIHIDIVRNGTTTFRSGLTGSMHAPVARWSLLKILPMFFYQNLMTLPRIHRQAASLHFTKKLRYYPKPAPRSPMTIGHARPTLLERLGAFFFRRLSTRIAHGRLRLHMPDGTVRSYGPEASHPVVDLHVTDYAFFRRILLDGDIGLGEAYMYGQWTTPNETDFIAFLIRNRDSFESGEFISTHLARVAHRLAHARKSNTKSRSRSNISAHYDLNNNFFRMFLDPAMLYSCAYFRNPDESLEEAQRNKMQMLISKAGIQPEHHVLEIGSGWGGMAMEMARSTGCRVTSITISREQLTLARERVAAAGLEGRVSIEFCDYRDLAGHFDRIISIEMIEAVGHEHLDDFFDCIDRSLKPGGRAVIQGITIPDDRYDAYRKSVDWIQKHIFPGGHLVSVGIIETCLKKTGHLRLSDIEDIGPHYARTLDLWRKNLQDRRTDLEALGYDDVFFRTWVYYFCYCEAAFATRTLGNHHFVIDK